MNIDGIIVVNKPADWTSQDVCSKLRGRLHVKKIGHTGTLDPMATGVLPVCMGKATRIIEYFDRDVKSYHATMQLGIITDTLDITGEVLKRIPFRIEEIVSYQSEIKSNNCDESGIVEVSLNNIYKAFSDYTGKISQIPPKYSAVQINGRRAYDMARAGENVQIKPRNITIYSNVISNIDIDQGIIEFDVSCSKGTYIRTICDDIGRTLGCGATMTALVRTSSGPFVLDLKDEARDITQFRSYDLADIIAMEDDEINSIVIPMDAPLCKLGTIEVDDNRVPAFCNGHPSGKRTYRIHEQTHFDEFYKVYGRPLTTLDFIEECKALDDGDFSETAKCKPEFLGIGQIVDGDLIPYKVIAER